MKAASRLEADSIGSLEVPTADYYGVQAERASRNFKITHLKMSPVFLSNLALIKKAAASVNFEIGLLTKPQADAIKTACDEVIAGKFAADFIVDPIQGGAGTSANMNMNEVIANRANELFDATENLDSFVEVSGALKACAISLSKMSNDLRLLSSGPRCGFAEINLPAKQNGSSIMPGKVNPVIPEVVSQAAFLVCGHDTTITMAAEAGQLELNAFEPVVFYQLFESFTALTGAIDTLVENCITGITANKGRCKQLKEGSVGIATVLCPYLGYQLSAKIAKRALKEKRSVRELVLESHLMSEEKLDGLLG